jgi:A/G-specific adenine glycosylase
MGPFQEQLLKWQIEHGRSFFWRKRVNTPWEWLLIELLLKKTKAETVNKYGLDFISKYSSPQKILKRSNILLEDLKIYGLQNQRKKALLTISKYVIENYKGIIPDSIEELKKIPYLGAYTANAILCFSSNQKVALIDVNIARIITRYWGRKLPKDLRNNALGGFAFSLLPSNNFVQYHYGLIDFASMICTKKPKCSECIFSMNCKFNN